MPTHGDVRTGIFNPKRRDTLRPEFFALIGLEFEFEYAWTMDHDDPFPGQAAWRFNRDHLDVDGFLAEHDRWIPDEDIEALEERPEDQRP